MQWEKSEIIKKIEKIRSEIGHKDVKSDILKLIFNERNNELIIVAADRSEKSNIIGKGGWVVGKLKEELGVSSIHVVSNLDMITRKYNMELSLKNLETVIEESNIEQLKNLSDLLKYRIDNIYKFDFREFIQNRFYTEAKEQKAVVALSGGVDSSFSLIISKFLGFNPLAVTVDPGSIILPKHFHAKIDKLCRKLGVEHHYLKVDMKKLIDESLNGKYHPCGRCSKIIEDKIFSFTEENEIPLFIFGDILSSGSQSILMENQLIRINLPALLSANKTEIKNLAGNYHITSSGVYGCPLLYEVHKKYPHMKKFSLQRILRETRAGALEPGEALDLSWSLFKKG
ncbi:MAG: 7-cyano-7-deazaguanine synthase [Methanomicrobiales archaeon]